MRNYKNAMVRDALATRPNASGTMIFVPGNERYAFCPETDWLYSVMFSGCEYYPLQRVLPAEWNDNFEGWNISKNGSRTQISIQQLRELKETDMNPDNAPTVNAIDFKGKFLIGSILKATGAVSFSSFPARHKTYEDAKKEAARLALHDKSKHFIVVCVEAIATVQDVVFL